jgi:hypothetical protein
MSRGVAELGLEILVARTKEELDMCFRVRYDVFGREYGAYDLNCYPGEREVDSFDTLPTTLNILALYDGKPAGAVRLIQKNEEVAKANGWVFGFEMERVFDMGNYDIRGIVLAELPRSSVLQEYRSLKDANVMMSLWAFAVKISRIRGITHLCASANPETDNLKEAAIIYQLLRKKCLIDENIDVKARDERDYLYNPGPYRRSLYAPELVEGIDVEKLTDEQLESFRLPKVLGVFAKIGCKFFGKPIYDNKVKGCSIPVHWSIRELDVEMEKRFDVPLDARF